MFENIQELVNGARKSEPLKLAVAAAGDREVMESVKKAEEMGIIVPILVGEKEKIENLQQDLNYQGKAEIVGVKSDREAAVRTMELLVEGKADYPMKGLLNTSIVLKALLDKKYGLRQNRLLSLVTLIYLEKEERIVIMTDGGMNIAPGLEEKVQITENAVELARIIGIDRPKVAPIAAVENVNPSMSATMEAAALSKMAERGQIKNAVIDGPLALDNAISLEAARHKGIEGPVAGRADILLVPDIETGNVLYKALVTYCGLDSASVVYGARLPLVLTSRADKADVKFNSIALGKLITRGIKKGGF